MTPNPRLLDIGEIFTRERKTDEFWYRLYLNLDSLQFEVIESWDKTSPYRVEKSDTGSDPPVSLAEFIAKYPERRGRVEEMLRKMIGDDSGKAG